ncbi:hypothetical protein EB796_012206 [Bugula neritina]|uniref:Uncharacterized protein n=1 Tax=Bugula neritina TaxID=10212 RepID=A0A7J7JT29_BUGNE|nr:hypothetical protein EB796_012206 [Bugula neritina]
MHAYLPEGQHHRRDVDRNTSIDYYKGMPGHLSDTNSELSPEPHLIVIGTITIKLYSNQTFINQVILLEKSSSKLCIFIPHFILQKR